MAVLRLFSLEFFPPRTPEAVEKLRAARKSSSSQLKPAFCSVTFGAGGSNREGTLATALEFRAEGIEAVPHVSCIGGTRTSLREVLAKYREHGIRHIVALRGDLPSGAGESGEFRYANELVTFIREETGDHFHIDVAAYPNITRKRKIRRKTWPRSSAKSLPARIQRSPSTSTTRMRTGVS
jgi:methylenetetrahydrofolate reductase (NADPH)